MRNSKKEKFYRLAPGILTPLLMPGNIQPEWINAPEMFCILENIWHKLTELSQITIDELSIWSELYISIKNNQKNYPDSFLQKLDIGAFSQEKVTEIYESILQTLPTV